MTRSMQSRRPGAARGSRRTAAAEAPERAWTFLTNHSHVLICLASGEAPTARELSTRIGITERAVQVILADLTDAGYVVKQKDGRRNFYTVNLLGRLRHPLESHHTVGDLIAALD